MVGGKGLAMRKRKLFEALVAGPLKKEFLLRLPLQDMKLMLNKTRTNFDLQAVGQKLCVFIQ